MYKNKFTLLWFCVLFTPLYYFSQNQTKSSSQNNLNDTNQIKSLIHLGDEALESSLDSSLQFYKKALQLAETKYTTESSSPLIQLYQKCLNKTAFTLGSMGKIKEALQYYKTSLKVAEDSNDEILIAKGNSNIGTSLQGMGDYTNALEYYLKSQKLREKLNDKKGNALVLSNIGSLYDDLNIFDNALDYYNRSLSIRTEIGDKRGISATLANIGSLYTEQKNYSKSLEYFSKSLPIAQAIEDADLIAQIYLNFGITYEALNEIEKSIKYYKIGLAMSEKNENDEFITSAFLGLGHCYFKQKNYDLALNYTEKGYLLAKEIGFVHPLNEALELLSQIHEAKGNPTYALKYYKMHSQLRDSLFTDETQQAILKQKSKYEYEIKAAADSIRVVEEKKTMAMQVQQNKLMVNLLAIGIVVLIIIGGLFYTQMRLRAKQQRSDLQQKLLRSQINSHFIFNTLSIIQSYITSDQTEEANTYLNKFARLLRLILENSREDYVPITDEIKTLENYMQIQKLLLNNKIDYTITVDSFIDPDNTLIPPMLAQPFIENSIKHGFSGSNKEGKISISFSLQKKYVLFEVADNGIGISKSQENKQQIQSTHKSLATQITQERLSIINKLFKKKIKINIVEIKNGTNIEGTRVNFLIPFKTT